MSTAVLTAATTALTSALVQTDVLVGRVPSTPTQPYVVLVAQSPTPRDTLGGHSHLDRVVLMVMAVNNSHVGALMLADKCRTALESVTSLDGPLRFDGGSAPIEEDHPGDYRWSVTWDYVAHVKRPHPTP